MLETNLDVNDRLVNGAIGIFKHVDVKHVPRTSNDNANSDRPFRVWLEFLDSNRTGNLLRCKKKPLIDSRLEILPSWTPIGMRTVSFAVSLKSKIICHRDTFPTQNLATALTVHT